MAKRPLRTKTSTPDVRGPVRRRSFADKVSSLRGVLGGRAALALTPADAEALAKDAGLSAAEVVPLAAATSVADRTGLPPEFLYGFFRSQKNAPALIDPKTISAALDAAVNAGQISALSSDARAEVMGQIESLRPRQRFATLSLADLGGGIQTATLDRVAAQLKKIGITTPGALFEGGAVPAAAAGDLSPDEMRGLRQLETEVRLSTLETSAAARGTLVDLGFTSPAVIAAAPAAIFKARLTPLIGAAEADRIHTVAGVQEALFDNLRTGARGAFRSGQRVQANQTSLNGSDTALVDCHCDDCEAATSPLAYLTDLLTYAQGRLSWGENDPVDAALLSNLLQQPYTELPADCAAVDAQVSQVRLCIESLLGLRRAELGADPDVACAPRSHSIAFAFAADVDGDRRDELIIGFERDLSSFLGPRVDVGPGVWVLRYDRSSGGWRHLAPGDDPLGTAFYLPPGLTVNFAFAGTFRSDTSNPPRDRQQLVFAVTDASAGEQPVLVVEFDPIAVAWSHVTPNPAGQTATVEPGGVFVKGVRDFSVPYPSTAITLKAGFATDVDGDGLDEFVAYGTTTAEQNPVWVFKLQVNAWATLGPAGNPYDVAFTCDPAVPGVTNYGIKTATAGDVNHDGRSEIVAIPDAPGNFGKNPWIMRYDPVAQTWGHLIPAAGLPLNADADMGPFPWPTAHALVGNITGANSDELVISPEGVLGPNPSDPNQFTPFAYTVGFGVNPDYFNELAAADVSANPDPVRLVLLADVDGDLRDELIVFSRRNNEEAAWVMDYTAAGAWQHLSPIPNHLMAADLDWNPSGSNFAARFAFAADVDGDGQKEVVVACNTCTQIWVLQYRIGPARWEHLRARPDPMSSRYEAVAYQALLLQLGTSYAEIRLARTADEKTRAQLADRLSIPLGVRQPNIGDRLDQLLLDPDTLTQDRLEQLLGLVATTRDPLSNVAVLGDAQSQTRHWRLSAAAWSGDPATSATDADGRIYVTLAFVPPTATVTVTLFRDAARSAAIATGQGGRSGIIRLSSMNGSGVSGSVNVEYVADTTGLSLVIIPQLACWQQQQLREQWDEADWPPDPFTATAISDAVPDLLPIIDPDIVGADDFRLPLPTGQATGAFDIWLARRRWIDQVQAALAALEPDLNAMLDSLRPPAGANPAAFPWRNAPQLTSFSSLLDRLTTGDANTSQAARDTIENDLFLPADAFVRLVALRATQQAGIDPLTEDDWTELRAILALANKTSQRNAWRQEERNAGIRLDGATFAAAPVSPSEGGWPPATGLTPLIEPEAVRLTDLPSSLAGVEARGLYGTRLTELRSNLDTVTAKRAQGLEAMFVEGFGTAPTGTTWTAWIVARAGELQGATAAAAETAIQAAIPGLTDSMVRRLGVIAARPAAAVSEADWTDAATLIALRRKYRVLYLAWSNEETNAARPLPYWKARRAVLPRWLASTDIRAEWELALRDHCRPPAIDPDLVDPSWLRSASSRAYELYYGRPILGAQPGRLSMLYTRTTALNALITGAATPLEGIDAAVLETFAPGNERVLIAQDVTARRQASSLDRVLAEVFGDRQADLAGLAADLAAGGAAATAATGTVLDDLCFSTVASFQRVMNAAGNPGGTTAGEWQAVDGILASVSILGWVVHTDTRATADGVKARALLDQLNITSTAWRRTCSLRKLAAQGSTLLRDEWNDLVDILVRTDKVRRFGQWRDEEHGDGQQVPVRLGPDSLRLPDASDSTRTPSPWRVFPTEIRQWRDTMDARTAQDAQVLAALQTSVARVEETTLPMLRDQMIAALPVASGASDVAAKWVEDYLLLDPAVGGCQQTTRVAMAIDTLLALLWSVRTGQLADTYPLLLLGSPMFDEEWLWMGSYSSWRSAMLVYLYPENLLLPTLRRDQSPGFRAAISALRGGSRLTPSGARRIASGYADYFRDVCTLDTQAMACAIAFTTFDRQLLVGTNRTEAFCEHRFAISGASGSCYWSLAVLSRTLESTPGFWKRLDQLSGSATAVIGATEYATADERWMYVFVQIEGENGPSLQACRYSLTRGVWQQDVITLELPENVTSFTAWLLPARPPQVALAYTTRAGGATQETHVYRSMNLKGTAWDRADFAPLIGEDWNPLGQPLGGNGGSTVKFLAGDFDGDGQDEIALVRSVAPTVRLWKLDRQSQTWSQLSNADPNGTLSTNPDVVVGHFMAANTSDARDQIVGIPLGVTSADNLLTAFRFSAAAGSWDVLGPGSGGQTLQASNMRFIVAGDFDGDGITEVATASENIAIPTGSGTPPPPNDTVFTWRWNGTSFAEITHFLPVPEGTWGVTQLAAAGDFDGDGRDELAVAIAPSVNDASQGNDFWVFDFRADGQRRGQLAPIADSRVQAALDFFEDPIPIVGTFCGDFDGDGRDELAVIPYVATPYRGNEIRIADFRPDPRDPDPGLTGSWGRLPSIDLSAEATPVVSAVSGDFDGDGFDEVALFGNNHVWVRKYDLASQSWLALPDTLVTGVAFGRSGNFSGPKPLTLRQPRHGARGKRTQDQLALVPGTLSIANGRPTPAASATAALSAERLVARARPTPCQHPESIPLYNGSWTLDDTSDRAARRSLTSQILLDNATRPASVQVCIWEAFYGLPIAAAVVLQSASDYVTALDWYRLVYDYSRMIPDRRLYAGLDDAGLSGTGYIRDVLTWAQDPLDPHAIAATRSLTCARGTLLLLVGCFLDFADAQFTLDTGEAIDRARILYETALELLDLPELDQRLGECSQLIARIPLFGNSPQLGWAARRLEQTLPLLGSRPAIRVLANQLGALLNAEGGVADRIAAADLAMAKALLSAPASKTIGSVLTEGSARAANMALVPRSFTGLAQVAASIASAVNGPADVARFFLTGNRFGFCVGPNPIIGALRLKAELNLQKIRTCRNIAGIRRAVEAYAGPIDQTSGLPTVGAGGQIALAPAPLLVPTPYRYAALIQRAKELVAHAAQLESLMLGALEKRDNEALTLLKTKQDIQVARATVRAQDLKVSEAEDRVVAATLQQQRATIEADHYQQLLDAGDLEAEREMFDALESVVKAQYAAAALNAQAAVAALATSSVNPSAASSALSSGAAAASSIGSAFATGAQILQLQAGLDRTRQDWQLKVQLAAQDERIAVQNTQIQNDEARIAEQERTVSELQADNAEQLLDFHQNKFTSFELYDWMSNVLAQSYRFFLQQATSVAQLAARQLAFERQDGQPPAIQPDYWEPPAQGFASGGASQANSGSTDRRGLTGSARLLQDIYQLDQWAFDTTKRKLQLTKTLSLARLAPLDFEQLRTTGVMTFTTPNLLFDYDFPGHYLRLIKRISVNVIALVPPSQGVHASLASTGLSRVVIGPDVFQPVIVQHPPEMIALTSPLNATGVFTFDTQSDLANPFESLGVETSWEFRMPRAGNRFDYRSLVDVQVTIDYTALDSTDYRQQVVRTLGQRFAGDRSFSLRNEFPDAWWDFHNPDQIEPPFAITFDTSRDDFPANLDDLRISQVALLFVTTGDIPVEAMPAELKFTEQGSNASPGGTVTAVDHLVSTRRANGGPLRPIIGKTPAGRWKLSITDSDDTRDWMAGDDLIDILLVVTYEGQTPAWPV